MTAGEGTSLRWPPASQERVSIGDGKGTRALAANKTQKVAKVQSMGKCESREVTGEATGAKHGKVTVTKSCGKGDESTGSTARIEGKEL